MQKKCYKVLAHICEQRSDFLEPQFHEVLEALLAGAPASLSAAKRNRLRCLKAAILAMTRPGGPLLQEASDKDDATKLVSSAQLPVIFSLFPVKLPAQFILSGFVAGCSWWRPSCRRSSCPSRSETSRPAPLRSSCSSRSPTPCTRRSRRHLVSTCTTWKMKRVSIR